MRELKFRAWVNNHWTDFIPVGKTLGIYNESIIDVDGYTYEKTNPFIVEQYTGLKDKNGQEIYEGDIVEQFVCGVHQFKGKKCGRSTIWQVRWYKEECCFELHYLRGSLFGDSMMSDDDEYEVIGNVHENKELLGGEE